MWPRRTHAAADQSGCLLFAYIRPSHARAPCHVCTTADHVCVATSDIAAASLSVDAEDGENAAPLDLVLDPAQQLDWAALLGSVSRVPENKPDGVSRVLCACGRNSDVGRKCLCGRVPRAQTPVPVVPAVPAAPAAPAWRWTSIIAPTGKVGFRSSE